jgi:hypothetical protein
MNVSLRLLLFIAGVATGLSASFIAGPFRDNIATGTTSRPDPEISGISARLDQIEARIAELVDRNNTVGKPTDDQALEPERPPAASDYTDGRNAVVRKNAAGQKEIDIETQQTAQNKIMDSLLDPTVTVQSILQSKDLQSLPVDKQNEVLQDIADRLNSGLLRKDQFLPGYTEVP